jgi:NAD(P)-dependent dehydrogenase (short-subunit alcohol dehydrogenase family)
VAARSVLITGTSTGIGRATALHLDALGFRVFAGVRRESDGDSLRAEASPRLEPLCLDVTDGACIEAAAKQLEAALGGNGLQGLVSNAGIAVPGAQEFLDLELLRRQFEVNVVGAVAVTQACLPLLRRGSGRIVAISSQSGFVATPFVGAYAASKHALEALMDSLRMELRPWRIQVSIVEPGNVATPIWEKGRRQGEALRGSLPPRALELYGAVLARLDAVVDASEARAVPPLAVARAVAHALSARRPRTRYRVGLDARATWWLRKLLPARWMDPLLLRLLGLPSGG